ncbi:cell wall assembly protein [Tautonia marina]|uniref:cell wall assembly protein n=1 Tax=Tautonia marina TaxID=2653855 RepID=UPI001261171D|nr:cell wall assembly protein [Tautonia marina]
MVHIRPEDRSFLGDVSSFNGRYNAVRVGQGIQELHHGFWRDAEIAKAEAIKADWEVPNGLVPFYGDWHDLICLHADTGRVVAIDDRRRFVAEWPSAQAFADSLCWVAEEQSAGDSGIVEDESWLDF